MLYPLKYSKRRTAMELKIYKELLNWKNNNIEMPLMVIRSKTIR